jgi:phosphate transport system substrate-binding protein
METLMKYWIEDFGKLHPGVKFDMEAKASGTAGPALTAGKAQLGPVAREMLPAEEKEFTAKFGYAPLAVRVGGGSYRTPGKTHAIAFFVNSKNPIEKLTYAQIDAMFTTTRNRGAKAIEKWGDVGLKGEWADKPIHLWGLIRPNGIAHFLEIRITKGGEWRTGINERTTVGSLAALDAVVQGVAADPYAVGYAGFGNTFEGAKTVALAENDNGPFYKGTFDEVLQQKFPLSRYIYIYVNRAPGKPIDPLTKEFLTFVLSKQGQDDLVKEGIFLPLPASVAKAELAKLK